MSIAVRVRPEHVLQKFEQLEYAAGARRFGYLSSGEADALVRWSVVRCRVIPVAIDDARLNQ